MYVVERNGCLNPRLARMLGLPLLKSPRMCVRHSESYRETGRSEVRTILPIEAREARWEDVHWPKQGLH